MKISDNLKQVLLSSLFRDKIDVLGTKSRKNSNAVSTLFVFFLNI